MNILIFRTGQLGDTLVSIPALKSVRDTYPEATISWLYDQHVGKSYVVSRSLLEHSGMVDQYLSYPVGYGFLESCWALIGVFRLWIRIRVSPYDLVIHLEPELKLRSRSIRDFWFFRTAGVQKQIQTLVYRKAQNRLHPLKALANEVDFFQGALHELGILKYPHVTTDNSLNLGIADENEVQSWLNDQFIPDNYTLIAVGLGSKMQSKLWPTEQFHEVLSALVTVQNVWPIFYGGPEDKEQAEQLITALKVGSNACGSLSLRGSACSMQNCRFYLGNDTGTMHLAVAGGIPCVAIFSARDVPGKWYPYGQGHFVHRVPVECEGCMLYECYEQKRRCLTMITSEAVLESCWEILNRESDDVPLVEVTDTVRRIFEYPEPVL